MANVIALFCMMFCSVAFTHGYQLYNAGDGWTHRLEVTQDVFLENPNTNFNNHPTGFLIVGRHAGFPLKRSLLQFENLSDACPLKKIQFAKMYVYFIYAHKASWHTDQQSPWKTQTINVHQVKMPWKESQATSSRRLNGINWNQQYLNLGKDAELNPLCSGTTLYTYRPSGFVEFDVTNAVKGWRSGIPNYGVLMKVEDETPNTRDFRFAAMNYKEKTAKAFILVKCSY